MVFMLEIMNFQFVQWAGSKESVHSYRKGFIDHAGTILYFMHVHRVISTKMRVTTVSEDACSLSIHLRVYQHESFVRMHFVQICV